MKNLPKFEVPGRPTPAPNDWLDCSSLNPETPRNSKRSARSIHWSEDTRLLWPRISSRLLVKSMPHHRTRSRMEAVLEPEGNLPPPLATPPSKRSAVFASRSSSRHRAKKRRTNDSSPSRREYVDLQDRLNHIIASLAMPDHEVQVARDWSNERNIANHREGVQAYAKLAGAMWTYYVQALHITIGRQSDSATSDPEEARVEIDLGPNKIVSRRHAVISYDLQDRQWQLSIYGRNGVKVDDRLYKESQSIRLQSGNVLEIGGVQMMFVLPDQPITLASSSSQNAIPEETAEKRKPSNTSMAYPKGVSIVYKSQVAGVEGVEDDVDLSHDHAKDIKPPYSYATMIAQAIMSSADGQLTLANIYSWIAQNYAFYRHAKSGWQNSIRHNLSLNKSFQKVPRRSDEPGKGMKWQIVPEDREEFERKIKTRRRNSTVPNSPMALHHLNGSIQQRTPSAYHAQHPSHPSAADSSIDIDPDFDLESSGGAPHFHRRESTPPGMSSYHIGSIEAFTPDRGNLATRPFFTPAAQHAFSQLPAPPSTQQLPSSYLPTSSPAPFWRYMINSTPGGHAEFSPTKLSSPVKANGSDELDDGLGDLNGVDLTRY